jgi:hypothetical protein
VIENELCDLLTARAGSVQDNPARVREVHARVAGIRRRRTAGAALVLVLLALAGALLTRLPGRPETLPAGVPAGPYFDDDGQERQIPDFRRVSPLTFSGTASWDAVYAPTSIRHVVVASCDRPGDLVLRGIGDRDRRLSCRVPVGDHHEGALLLPEDPLLMSDMHRVDLIPGSGGEWTVSLLQKLYPEQLSQGDLSAALLSGLGSPGGGQFTVTIPSTIDDAHALMVIGECLRGVRLQLSIGGRPLVDFRCDDAHLAEAGLPVTAQVTAETIRALGLRGLQRVTIDVRSIGRQTDQWAIFQVS